MTGGSLFDAIAGGDAAAVTRALERPGACDARDAYARHPLVAAATERGATPAVLEAVLHGCAGTAGFPDVRARALGYAVEAGRVAMVRLLDPDRELSEAMARGIHRIVLDTDPAWEIMLNPHDLEALVNVQRKAPRAQETWYSASASAALAHHRADLRAAGAAWLAPLLERVAREGRVPVADMEAAQEEALGLRPRLWIWRDGYLGPELIRPGTGAEPADAGSS